MPPPASGEGKMKIAFDIGGVLSKYPGTFCPLLKALYGAPGVEVWIISDMPAQKAIDMLRLNGLASLYHRVRSADYATHGEECKAVLCRELGIDILVDDFIGYVATPGAPPVRLLVMPDPTRDYYAPGWKTDGSEGAFGRRNPPESKGPGRPKNPTKGGPLDRLLAAARGVLDESRGAGCDWDRGSRDALRDAIVAMEE